MSMATSVSRLGIYHHGAQRASSTLCGRLCHYLGGKSVKHGKTVRSCCNSGISHDYVQRNSHDNKDIIYQQVRWYGDNAASRKEKLTIEEDCNENILIIPFNLKLDPKSISSPFYGMDKIEREEEEVGGGKEEDLIESYDLKTKPLPLYVTPLPQRLNVPVLPFVPKTMSFVSDDSEIDSSSYDDVDVDTKKKVNQICLNQNLFGCDPIRQDILHRCVIYQRNKKRGRRNAGARTKTISEVSGSGRKVRQQKGSGNARAGHSRPAHWRGGAKAHGPKGAIQNYETKINKKVKRLAIKMALSQKLKENNLFIVDTFQHMQSHKTKYLASLLDALDQQQTNYDTNTDTLVLSPAQGIGIASKHGSTAYIVDHVVNHEEEPNNDNEEEQDILAINGTHVNLHVASKNLHKIKVTNQLMINVYDILKHERLIISLPALQALEDRFASYA
mmetsp:Transcript_18470/g.26009  ORF Transcript_18470/g.26009 Transcript_18470/m.26009 type:complete len:445 (+) Transcript_18470:54-1388(+)